MSAQVVSNNTTDATTNDDSDNNTNKKTYKIQCKRGNHSLKAMCTVDVALYPVLQPPQWSLTGNTLQWGQDHGSQDSLTGTTATDASSSSAGATSAPPPPLHQARLAALEARVNDMDGLVKYLQQKDGNYNDLDNDDKDEIVESYYYDWILTHQLREILLEWDEWVVSGDNNNNATTTADNNSNSTSLQEAVRTVRGRDRAKVE